MRTYEWHHGQESNLYLALRRRSFYPLNYRGKGVGIVSVGRRRHGAALSGAKGGAPVVAWCTRDGGPATGDGAGKPVGGWPGGWGVLAAVISSEIGRWP